MSKDADRLFPVLVFKGRHAAASYLDQAIAAYRGNPYIEALPPILTEGEAMEVLARYPDYDESERLMPSHLRLHQTLNALQLFAPLPVHLDLEGRLSRLIRFGYQSRNPLTPGIYREITRKIKALSPSTSVVCNSARPSPIGITIIGFPGVGKSTSVESVLSLYPQVIHHRIYKGRKFTQTQVVWLKLGCPPDGSTRGLCLNFFQAIDDILGTSYYENYASGRRTLDELLPQMARLAANLGLGVLVIDEIQRLSQAKSGGAEKMLNFFVQLTDGIGVPVVLIGTPKARRILCSQFHQIRRGTGQGDLVWDRMEEGKWVLGEHERGEEGEQAKECRNGLPGVWQLFLESLWRYQYARVSTPLTKELSHALYEETQGITDFAAKAYMLAQIRVITTAKSPEEEVLTPDIIRSVAWDSLKEAQRLLNALRMGDTEVLGEYDDVSPIDMSVYIQKAMGALRSAGKAFSGDGEAGQEVPDNSQDGTNMTGTANEKEEAQPTKRKKPRKPKKAYEAIYADGDLRAGLSDSADTGATVDESLRQAGYIQASAEYVGEEGAA